MGRQNSCTIYPMSSNGHNRAGNLAVQNARLRTGILILIALVVFELLQQVFLINLPRGMWITFESLLLLSVGGLIFTLVDNWRSWRSERQELQNKLALVQERVETAEQRQQALWHISQALSEALSEQDVMEKTLQLAREVSGALAASFVPLDEHAQPLAPLTLGEVPFGVSDAWLQYLASPPVRNECRSCEHQLQHGEECILLPGAMRDVYGIYCVPVRRGEQEYGVLNIYLPKTARLDQEAQNLLRKLVEEASLALQGKRLQNRELATLRQINLARQKTDLGVLLKNLVDDLTETLESDYSMALVLPAQAGKQRQEITAGHLPPSARPLIDGILQSVVTSGEPVSLGEVAGEGGSSPGVRALLAVPLLTQEEQSLGALVVANKRSRAFSSRHLLVLQTVASQVSLVIQNLNLLAALEYKTMMEERNRLAREIHDGLAQALGFLKLKLAQAKNYVDFQEYERLDETIPACLDTVTEMYQDAREAIDGLRIASGEASLSGWLRQTVTEFQENTQLVVHLDDQADEVNLPPEVHAQLVRIVQEALINVRKHAHPKQVWVSSLRHAGDLIIEVRDDGSGFDITDVPRPSRHGLQGMRERAELIGADFQVIGLPGHGTTVRIRLPLLLGVGR